MALVDLISLPRYSQKTARCGRLAVSLRRKLPFIFYLEMNKIKSKAPKLIKMPNLPVCLAQGQEDIAIRRNRALRPGWPGSGLYAILALAVYFSQLTISLMLFATTSTKRNRPLAIVDDGGGDPDKYDDDPPTSA
ncbi:hypothetical protein BT63DRAFT_449548 [Microthyrium microscopicum]|uniref:Uncharacterized protein n=1 Tax=Microthyrium microscopicum TaxID=703497 RepID=A0A6A6UQJ3_9PEZI|nr:hypothetical protein BT63DRAFT_449548 [Microthyrium microscopicum]